MEVTRVEEGRYDFDENSLCGRVKDTWEGKFYINLRMMAERAIIEEAPEFIELKITDDLFEDYANAAVAHFIDTYNSKKIVKLATRKPVHEEHLPETLYGAIKVAFTQEATWVELTDRVNAVRAERELANELLADETASKPSVSEDKLKIRSIFKMEGEFIKPARGNGDLLPMHRARIKMPHLKRTAVVDFVIDRDGRVLVSPTGLCAPICNAKTSNILSGEVGESRGKTASFDRLRGSRISVSSSGSEKTSAKLKKFFEVNTPEKVRIVAEAVCGIPDTATREDLRKERIVYFGQDECTDVLSALLGEIYEYAESQSDAVESNSELVKKVEPAKPAPEVVGRLAKQPMAETPVSSGRIMSESELDQYQTAFNSLKTISTNIAFIRANPEAIATLVNQLPEFAS